MKDYNKDYREGIINSIKILDDEIQRLREYRQTITQDEGKMRINEQILSHILSIEHLREAIGYDEEED